MKCEKIEELLSPYLENELSPEEKGAVAKHLKTCENCSLLFSFMEETKESLAGIPELEVSENLLDRLYSISSKKKRFKLRLPSLDFLVRPSLQPVLTVATIMLIMISFYFFGPNKSSIDKSISRQIHLGYSKIERLYAKAESFTASLGEHKDNILVSLKNIKLLGGNED
jgi:predicted anti-sigma-YlaC factor YlaD